MTSAKALPKLAAASLCICAAAMLGAGAAMADDPGSMSEAQAMGDPAASAPAVDAPNVFIYQGEEISEKTASELELACVQSIEQYNCRDSEDEFGSDSMARASKGKKGASASAACGVVELWLYQHKQYGGWANGGPPVPHLVQPRCRIQQRDQ